MPDSANATSPSPGATNGQCQLLVDISSSAAPAQPPAGDGSRERSSGAAAAVLELRVRNHPGTMSHITGHFARRGFNLEAIVCVPVDDGATSSILLLVADEPRLDQVERQLAKLYDVLLVRHRPDLGPGFFSRLVPAATGGPPG
jgi:acetolactate synthase-1/3 small subunit